MCPAPVCVCVLCGLPAAGKSRLARELRGHAHARGWRTLIVTYDELIPARDWRQAEWKHQRKMVLMCLERFLRQTHTPSDDQTHTLSDEHTHTEADAWMRFEQLLLRQDVSPTHTHSHTQPLILVLDDNFYYQSMRQQIQQLARKYALGFCQLFLQTPVQVCVQRNRARAAPVPDAVLQQMLERMEPPEPHRNAWERPSLTLDGTTHTHPQELMDLLTLALESPLTPVPDTAQQQEEDRSVCASSVLHRADQTCRRVVSQAVSAARERRASPEQLKALAKHLNELKTELLRELRDARTHTPQRLTQVCAAFEQRALEAVDTHSHDTI